MPRKQRFKPSRKPKPIPQHEETGMGQPVNSATARDDSESSRNQPQVLQPDPTSEPDLGSRSG
jgi:hypothetical protein